METNSSGEDLVVKVTIILNFSRLMFVKVKDQMMETFFFLKNKDGNFCVFFLFVCCNKKKLILDEEAVYDNKAT